jgi:hypothetical protein
MKTEKIIILGCFIVVGIYVIAVSLGFPRIPNTMSSGFFPAVSASLLVCFSLAELIRMLLGKTETEDKSSGKGNFLKIMLVTAMLIAMVLLMRFVHPLAGISIFLFAYLVLIAKTRILLSLPIFLIGTLVIYVIIRLLKIPL